MEATQTTIPGTETHTHTNGHATTETTTKKPNPGYIAFVTFHGEPGDDSTEATLQQIHAQTKTELAKKLADPKVAVIFAVVKGRQVEFNTSRKITF